MNRINSVTLRFSRSLLGLLPIDIIMNQHNNQCVIGATLATLLLKMKAGLVGISSSGEEDI